MPSTKLLAFTVLFSLAAAWLHGDGLKPGLVAVYRSAGVKASAGALVVRIDLRPGFNWGSSSPHPRLGESGFEAIWRGSLILKEDVSFLRWGAYACGSLTLEIGGRAVLRGEGADPRAWI